MSSMRPWDGDEPPISIYDDPTSFDIQDDGVRIYPSSLYSLNILERTFTELDQNTSEEKGLMKITSTVMNKKYSKEVSFIFYFHVLITLN